MKKILAILLAVAIVLGLCACGGTGGSGEGGSNEASGLQAGFGKKSILTKQDVWLAGGDNADRISNGYLSDIFVTCVALKNGDETVLVCTIDLINSNEGWSDPAREKMAEATGVPLENIVISATHTHSAPGAAQPSRQGISEYRDTVLYPACVAAAEEAIADLSAATLHYGSAETENLNFVRHYKLDNGTYAGSNFGDFNSGTIVGHVREADNKVLLLKLAREAEDKKDIVLMNWGTHATLVSSGSGTSISADHVGATRDYIEEQTDCLVAYYIGAAGDQIPSSKVSEEYKYRDVESYGKAMGDYVVAALETLTASESEGISINEISYTVDSNKEKIDMYDQAKEVADTNDTQGKTAANILVAQYGFASVYEANAIVKRYKAEPTTDLPLTVIAVGDVGFAFTPYETFGVNGSFVKENSPYAMTFMVSMTNGAYGYVPCEEAFTYGCYETHVTELAPGTAEKVASQLVTMLTELKGE